MRTAFGFLAVVAAGFAILPAQAQDIPGTSPMDHAAMSMAHTSGTIDSLTTGEVARTQRSRSRTKARKAASARRQRDAVTTEACKHSTPILKSMGLNPAPECL